MLWTFEDFSDELDISKFDCGTTILNEYLGKYLRMDIKRKAAVPTMAIDSNKTVLGFYTLSSGSVEFKNFPISKKRKIAPYPVPIARIVSDPLTQV